MMYDSLFNGATRPLSPELQAEMDAITKTLEAQLAEMSDEEKQAEFERIMNKSR